MKSLTIKTTKEPITQKVTVERLLEDANQVPDQVLTGTSYMWIHTKYISPIRLQANRFSSVDDKILILASMPINLLLDAFENHKDNSLFVRGPSGIANHIVFSI